MPSSSFRLLFSLAVLLAASFLTPPARAQTPYRDPGAWCTVTFPKDWKPATKDKAEKLKRDASVTGVEFRTGFAKSLKNGELELPLAVLVTQPMSMSGVNYENFEDRFEGDMRVAIFPAVQTGATEFFLGSDVVTHNLSIAGGGKGFAGQKSDVKGIVYSYVTRNGLVHLACFDTASRFDASLPMFEEVADSMRIDRGQEFAPKQTTRRYGRRGGIYGGFGGLGLIVVLLLGWWARR